MPAWVVGTINGVLLAYCVFMYLFGHFKKKKMINKAKEEIKEEFKDEIENHNEKQ